MALGGHVCPWCGFYTPREDARCARCGRWVPPELLAKAIRSVGGVEHWATKLLCGISIVVFSFQLASAGLAGVGLLRGMPVWVLLRFGALASGIELAEPWRLLAACFVHMGLLHVAMNVMAIADLGRLAESRIGGERLVLSYVVTGALGFLVSTWWYQHQNAPYITAGASGAAFGIDGVVLGDMMIRRDKRWKDMLIRTVIYSVVFYYAFGTNQAAHIGGLVVGILLGFAFAKETRPWRIAMVVHVATGVALIATLASLTLPHLSPIWRQALEMQQARERGRHGVPVAPGEE